MPWQGNQRRWQGNCKATLTSSIPWQCHRRRLIARATNIAWLTLGFAAIAVIGYAAWYVWYLDSAWTVQNGK